MRSPSPTVIIQSNTVGQFLPNPVETSLPPQLHLGKSFDEWIYLLTVLAKVRRYRRGDFSGSETHFENKEGHQERVDYEFAELG